MDGFYSDTSIEFEDLMSSNNQDEMKAEVRLKHRSSRLEENGREELGGIAWYGRRRDGTERYGTVRYGTEWIGEGVTSVLAVCFFCVLSIFTGPSLVRVFTAVFCQLENTRLLLEQLRKRRQQLDLDR